MIPHDPRHRLARLRDIQHVMDELREPIAAPDLTSTILGRVHDERPFLSPRVRRLLWVGRAGAAAIAIGAALGIIMTRRELPDIAAEPAPISDLANSCGAHASSVCLYQFRSAGLLSFPAVSGSLSAPSGDQPGITYVSFAPQPSTSEETYDASPPPPPFPARAAGIAPGMTFVRFDPLFGPDPFLSRSIPSPFRRVSRNLLNDLPPVITGEPAGEGLSPR
jgi:hypothetical protein